VAPVLGELGAWDLPAPRPSRARSRSRAVPRCRLLGQAMQLHGGMGYTWESGIHVFLKRAALNRSLSGSPAAHRQRLASRYRAG
jgi:Acyl-CoA dehydrogenase, C-terminal domain